VADSLEYRLIKAAKKVGENHPYYSPAVARVRFREDIKGLPTMAINCSLVITYNKSYVEKLTNEKLENLVLHEVLHYMNAHHSRYMNSPLRDSLSFATHNIAMDLEIHEIISDLAGDGFSAKDFGLPERKSYEEYLGMINRDMPPKLKELLESGNIPDGDLNVDDYNGIYLTILDDLIKECERKQWGTEEGSGDTMRRIKKRKYPWEQVFQNIITTKITEIVFGHKYRTFEKANRRYAHFSDVILPQLIDRKSKISLAIVMDISGSMGDNVDKMYGTMKSIMDIQDLQIDITILEVDVAVENIMHDFDLHRETVESKDGGGTDMGAGLQYIQDNQIESDLIIVMTDSYTPWPEPPILADKTVVLTDNPGDYDGPYPMFPVIF